MRGFAPLTPFKSERLGFINIMYLFFKMTFDEKDVKKAYVNMRTRHDKYTMNTANAFIKKIQEDPAQPVVCRFSLTSAPEASVHIMLEAVAYLLFTKGHRMAHKIKFTQTSVDTEADIKMQAESNRMFTADIVVHILPKDFIAKNKTEILVEDANTINTDEEVKENEGN